MPLSWPGVLAFICQRMRLQRLLLYGKCTMAACQAVLPSSLLITWPVWKPGKIQRGHAAEPKGANGLKIEFQPVKTVKTRGDFYGSQNFCGNRGRFQPA